MKKRKLQTKTKNAVSGIMNNQLAAKCMFIEDLVSPAARRTLPHIALETRAIATTMAAINAPRQARLKNSSSDEGDSDLPSNCATNIPVA